MKKLILGSMIITIILWSCSTDEPSLPLVQLEQSAASPGPPRMENQVENIISGVGNTVFDVDGNEVVGAPDETLLYDFEGNPVLAPDGSQLTKGDWVGVTGRAKMKCVGKGTLVTLHFSGLIPNGLYTIWNAQFDPPFDGTFNNLIGLGALGPNDGSKSAFTASASGEGQISVIVPPGDLSMFGSIDGCLTDNESHLIGHYHTDGQTHGPVFGPGVDQFAIIFW